MTKDFEIIWTKILGESTKNDLPDKTVNLFQHISNDWTHLKLLGNFDAFG